MTYLGNWFSRWRRKQIFNQWETFSVAVQQPPQTRYLWFGFFEKCKCLFYVLLYNWWMCERKYKLQGNSVSHVSLLWEIYTIKLHCNSTKLWKHFWFAALKNVCNHSLGSHHLGIMTRLMDGLSGRDAEKYSATQGGSSPWNTTERTCLRTRVTGKSAALCGSVSRAYECPFSILS